MQQEVQLIEILIKPTKKFGLNYVPDSPESRNFLFLYIFIRTVIVTYITIFCLYPVFYLFNNTSDFGAQEVIFFSFIFVFFEEQSRWLFTESGKNKTIEAYRFAILFSLSESFLYYLGNDYILRSFLLDRLPSFVLHIINSTICQISYINPLEKYRTHFFVIAILIHVLFNQYLAYILFEVIRG